MSYCLFALRLIGLVYDARFFLINNLLYQQVYDAECFKTGFKTRF